MAATPKAQGGVGDPAQTPSPSAAQADPSAQPVRRYGIVDMGSNAIRMQIVAVRPDGTTESLESHREPVRLGREVFLTGMIPEETVTAAVEVFRRFRETCDTYNVDRIRAVATSATREALNGDLLLERIRNSSGIEIEIISGTEEALLLNSAVQDKVDLSTGRSMIVDVGGGSVEVLLVDSGQVVSAESYRVGALRLLQAITGMPNEEDGDFLSLMSGYLSSLDKRIRDAFGEVKVDRYVATGGNIESLAELLEARGQGMQEGDVPSYPLSAMEEVIQDLALQSYHDRIQRTGLKPDRADTILPAGVVYLRFGRVARMERVMVPRVGLRDGLMRQVVEGHVHAFRAEDHQNTVLAACRSIGRKFRYDEDHAETTMRLATDLFDGTQELHGLEVEERTLLQAAAQLHDIGIVVGNPRHHKHTYYLIRESDILGLTSEEREIVALVARYHRKAPPTMRHEAFAALPRAKRMVVTKLAALLRAADALDRRRCGAVKGLSTKVRSKRVELILQRNPEAEPDAASDPWTLEQWALARKGEPFRDTFGRELRIVGDAST